MNAVVWVRCGGRCSGGGEAMEWDGYKDGLRAPGANMLLPTVASSSRRVADHDQDPKFKTESQLHTQVDFTQNGS